MENTGMLLLTAVLCLQTTALTSPEIDLVCRLDPDASKMHVHADLGLPPQRKAAKNATFFLSDHMSFPKVSIVEPADLAGEIVPTTQSTHDHDVTYQLALRKEV